MTISSRAERFVRFSGTSEEPRSCGDSDRGSAIVQTDVPLPQAAFSTTGSAEFELAAVYREHGERVKRWALRLGGPGLDAEDIAHEVFLVVQRRLPEFRAEAKLTTWLYRITIRVVRKQDVRQRLRRWARGLVGDFAAHVPDEDIGPYESMERQHAARLVYRALEGLNHKHRTAVILYELEGHSGEDIAELMETKLATVWVWLHRGRAKFHERLRELVGEPEGHT
jgi:RNA polymerase sigma-70 factor (ECF subfamily)